MAGHGAKRTMIIKKKKAIGNNFKRSNVIPHGVTLFKQPLVVIRKIRAHFIYIFHCESSSFYVQIQ